MQGLINNACHLEMTISALGPNRLESRELIRGETEVSAETKHTFLNASPTYSKEQRFITMQMTTHSVCQGVNYMPSYQRSYMTK